MSLTHRPVYEEVSARDLDPAELDDPQIDLSNRIPHHLHCLLAARQRLLHILDTDDRAHKNDDMSSSSEIVESWISAFCNLTGHEYFAEVAEDFIEDDFNLTGLSSQVPLYKEALEQILDVEPEEDDLEEEEEEDDDDDDAIEVFDEDGQSLGFQRANRRHARLNADSSAIEGSAELLYGLIHQRYIISRPGIGQMHEKYELGHFGFCPRVHCNSCRVLPVGLSDTPGQETVKLFCPSCLDVYTPPNSRFQTVDGAFFGTTFGCLFFMTYPELQVTAPRVESEQEMHATGDVHDASRDAEATASRKPRPSRSPPNQPTEINGMATSNLAPGLGADTVYEPRIYGFRVAEVSRTGPRMKWLRMKPDDVTELDEVARYEADDDPDLPDADAEPRAAAIQEGVDKRKKAPIRRRRRTAEDTPVAAEGGMNGVNGVG